MFCWQCGKELYPGAFFCTNCGMKIGQPVPPVQGAAGTAQNFPEVTAQLMRPVTAAQAQEMMAPEIDASFVREQAVSQEQTTSVLAAPGKFMESTVPMKDVLYSPPMAVNDRAIPGAGQHETVPPAGEKPRTMKKGVIIAVIVVATFVFFAGVFGAFYFAEDGRPYNNPTVGQRETVEKDKVDSQEPEDYTGEESAEGDFGRQDGTPAEDPDMNSREDEISEETDGQNSQEDPADNEEDFRQGPKVAAFSGRDVYPDIDGYAEGHVGDSMHTYWFDYTVTYAYVCAEYGGYTPTVGNELLVVEVAVKNTFSESIPMFDDDFQAQWDDPADDAFAWPLLDAQRLGEDILPEKYTLEKGQMVTGLLLFEVPEGYSEFSISYLELFDDDSVGDVFFLYFTANREQNNLSL